MNTLTYGSGLRTSVCFSGAGGREPVAKGGNHNNIEKQ